MAPWLNIIALKDHVQVGHQDAHPHPHELAPPQLDELAQLANTVPYLYFTYRLATVPRTRRTSKNYLKGLRLS